MTNQMPTMRTQEVADAERLERIKNDGSGREVMLAMLSAFSYSSRNLPTTDDYGKIVREALDDFSRSNYSEARSAVESLAMIVEFYKDLAENLLSSLTQYGIRVDEGGDVVGYPFVLLSSEGDQLLGDVEVLEYDPTDCDPLWEHYVKPYIPFASKRQQEWIAEEFADQIAKEQADAVLQQNAA